MSSDPPTPTLPSAALLGIISDKNKASSPTDSSSPEWTMAPSDYGIRQISSIPTNPETDLHPKTSLKPKPVLSMKKNPKKELSQQCVANGTA